MLLQEKSAGFTPAGIIPTGIRAAAQPVAAPLHMIFAKDLGRTRSWCVFYVLLALDLIVAILTFDGREALSSIASGLTRLVLDGTIGLAIRAKYADKAARGR